MGLKEAIINSDLYVSFVALGLGLAAYAVYGIPFSDPAPLLIIFLLTLNIYAMNRQTDQQADEINLPQRTRFVRAHGRWIFMLSCAGLTVALALSAIRSLPLGAASLLAFLSGYFYSYPLPSLGRFKDFLVWKNIGVGLIYGFLALIVPLYFGLDSPEVLAPLFLLFFVRFFLISSFFDLRDVEGDRKAGIRTIPIALGKDTLAAFHALNILPLLLFMPLFAFGFVSALFLLLCILASLYGLVYLLGFRYGIDMKFLCMVVADAEAMVAALLLIAAAYSGLI